MAIEQVEVTDFFQRHKPFSDIPQQELSHLASRVEIAYFKACLLYTSPSPRDS